MAAHFKCPGYAKNVDFDGVQSLGEELTDVVVAPELELTLCARLISGRCTSTVGRIKPDGEIFHRGKWDYAQINCPYDIAAKKMT